MFELISFLSGCVLTGIILFYRFRRQIAEANKIIEESKKIAAEKDKTIAEMGKTIAEERRTVAETAILSIGAQKAQVDLRAAQYAVQDALEAENRKYKDAQQAFARCINDLANKCVNEKDASNVRVEAIRILTSEVIYTFCTYAEKAAIGYIDDSPAILASFILTEIDPFFQEISASLVTLNDSNVLNHCNYSKEPLLLSAASMGSIDRCLLMLIPKLDENQRDKIIEKLKDHGAAQYLPALVSEV